MLLTAMLVCIVCTMRRAMLLVCLLQWEHPSVVMVVYDVTNEMSFSSCEKWLEQVLAQKPGVKFPGRFKMQKCC